MRPRESLPFTARARSVISDRAVFSPSLLNGKTARSWVTGVQDPQPAGTRRLAWQRPAPQSWRRGERDLENFMGAAASARAARWGLCAAFVGTRVLGVDPRELRVVFERGGRSVELRAVLDSVPAQVDDWGRAFAVRTTDV